MLASTLEMFTPFPLTIPGEVADGLQWYIANGEGWAGPGTVGVWALRIERLVFRDLYGSADNHDITPPNPHAAIYVDESRDRILLVFRDPDGRITWEEGSEDYFELDDSGAAIIGETVISDSCLLLQLDGPSSATTLSYKGHRGDGPWVTNARGVDLLAFDSAPIPPVSRVSQA